MANQPIRPKTISAENQAKWTHRGLIAMCVHLQACTNRPTEIASPCSKTDASSHQRTQALLRLSQKR